jgi:hypothetical protein
MQFGVLLLVLVITAVLGHLFYLFLKKSPLADKIAREIERKPPDTAKASIDQFKKSQAEVDIKRKAAEAAAKEAVKIAKQLKKARK